MGDHSASRLCARSWSRRRYKDNYPEKTLRAWVRNIRKWKRQRRTVFVYFDNDQKRGAQGCAAFDRYARQANVMARGVTAQGGFKPSAVQRGRDLDQRSTAPLLTPFLVPLCSL